MRKSSNRINKFLIISFSILIMSLFNNNQEDNISYSNSNASASPKTIYIIQGNESSTSGDGTESNPYQSILYAVSKANDGDTIKLLENIEYRQPAANVNFEFTKDLIIDGNNYTLSFRGSNLEILGDVEFKNMTLNIIPDGSSTTKIYASGNELTFNNVSTLISQAQSSERPTIIGGSASGSKSGTHTKINILNGSSETRFKEIIAGSDTSNSSLPVTINITSEYSKVDNGINLGGSSNYKVTGAVNITTNSKNIKKIIGTNSTNNTLTITDSIIYNIELTNIKNINLKNNAEITPTNFNGITGDLNLSNGTALWVNTVGQVSLNNLKGPGELIISTDSNLLIKGNTNETSNIKINGFESDLYANINKVYVEILGTINQNTKVSLYNENDYYLINKEDTKYRLIEDNGFNKSNIKKIEVNKKPNKTSYLVGETLNLTGLILKLTDSNNLTLLVDYTNLKNYNITYSPTSKLTSSNKDITINCGNLTTTIPITVTEKTTPKKDSETYKPLIQNQQTKLNEKLTAKSFITNSNTLPSNTKYTFEKEPNYTILGNQTINIIITYPDNSKITLQAIITIVDNEELIAPPQEEQEQKPTQDNQEQQPNNQLPNQDNKEEAPNNPLIEDKEEIPQKEVKPNNENKINNSNNKSFFIIRVVIVLLIILISITYTKIKK